MNETLKQILEAKKERAEAQDQLTQMERWYTSKYSVRDKTVFIEKDYAYVSRQEARKIMIRLEEEIVTWTVLIEELRDEMNAEQAEKKERLVDVMFPGLSGRN